MTQKGKITGVETSTHQYSAGIVVLATGAWTQLLGNTANLKIPAEWVHGEALITEPIPPSISNAMSSASFFEEASRPKQTVVALALKQRPEGNLMLGEAITRKAQPKRDVAAASIARVAQEAWRRLSPIKNTAVVRSWGIPVAHTADHRPLLGPMYEIENLWVAAALKSTIVLTPIVGEVMAQMITGQKIDPRFAEFSPSRKLQDPDTCSCQQVQV
jgi:glycine/D-amino acid oxidase-like deaminating enzyme